jgi:enoyl-CoA hydratase/carnithine racemase
MSTDVRDIEIAVEGSVAAVTLNRPRKRNAVSLAMWKRLAEILAELKETPEVRVVILTGAGGNFCAGADISEFETIRADAEAARAYEQAADAATIAIKDWPGPTIAAISGYAMGGGCGLALACDFRVADPSAKIGISAARLGIIYGTLDTSLLHRQVGLANAKRILFSGEALLYEECLRIGLVDIPADTDALTTARELANRFADNAPLTLKGAKFILEAVADGSAASKTPAIAAIIDHGEAQARLRGTLGLPGPQGPHCFSEFCCIVHVQLRLGS